MSSGPLAKSDPRDSLVAAILLTLLIAPVGLVWTAWCFKRNWRRHNSAQWLLLLVFAVIWTAVFVKAVHGSVR